MFTRSSEQRIKREHGVRFDWSGAEAQLHSAETDRLGRRAGGGNQARGETLLTPPKSMQSRHIDD
jgi:hypothetical protein